MDRSAQYPPYHSIAIRAESYLTSPYDAFQTIRLIDAVFFWNGKRMPFTTL